MTTNFMDLDDGLAGAKPAAKQTDAELRAKTSMVNGGDSAAAPCPACGGSGSWRGRGICFKCKGKGRVSKGVAAAAKGKETKERNRLQWDDNHKAEITYARKRSDRGSTFYNGLLDSLASYGTWTENQVALIQRDMAKDAAFYAARKTEREAAAPKVEISAIEALFARATNNDVKFPVFRAAELTLAMAKANSRNPGAIYVTATVPGKAVNGTYLGKIVGGRFHAYGNPPAETASQLMAIAANPDEEALRYASNFSACGICGTAVVAPVSVRSVIGPVCAARWGLEHLREAAREELRSEQEQHKAAGGL